MLVLGHKWWFLVFFDFLVGFGGFGKIMFLLVFVGSCWFLVVDGDYL